MMLNSPKLLRSCCCLVLLSVSCLTSLTQVPAVPQNVRGYRFPAEILLQWEPSQGAAYYRIDVAGLDRRWRPLATHVTETSFRDTGLFELTPLYQVAAVSASGEVATAPEIFVQGTPVPMRFWGVWISQPAQVTIKVASANAPPFAPSDLTALPMSRKRIQLTWTDHSMREQGFAIERADDNTGFKQIAQVGANVLTYTDGGLNPSRTYSYRVRAFNNNGASEASNVASAVPVK